jgi:hypothetical protein
MPNYSDFSMFYNNSLLTDNENYGNNPTAINSNEDNLNDLYINNSSADPAMTTDNMSTNIQEIDYHQEPRNNNYNKSLKNNDFNKDFEFYRLLEQVINNNKKYNKMTSIYKYLQLLSDNNLLIDKLKTMQNNKSPEINELIKIHNDTLDLIDKKINEHKKENTQSKSIFNFISSENLLSPDAIMIYLFILIFLFIKYN